MKIIFFLLITITAFGQLTEVTLKTHQTNSGAITTIDSIGKVWKNRKDINANHGTVYDYALEDDTARYQHNPPGKKLRARTTYYDPTIGFPSTDPTPPIIEEKTIDVTKTIGTFTNTWVIDTTPAPGWLNSTIVFSSTVGATWTYNFTGTGIELWAERRSGHGTGMISIDGVEVTVSFKDTPYGLPVLIHSFKGLENKEHTLRLRVVSGYNLIDYVKVFSVK